MTDLRRLAATAKTLAPGIFIIGYVIGTGSVTTMASAGASYGMSLLWTLIPASLFTHVMVVGISRVTILSGDTILHVFRRHFGSTVTVVVIGSLMATQLTSIIGVMAIVVDVLREWTATYLGYAVPMLGSATFFTLLLVMLFWVGRHDFFLKVLAALVSVMGWPFSLPLRSFPPRRPRSLRD